MSTQPKDSKKSPVVVVRKRVQQPNLKKQPPKPEPEAEKKLKPGKNQKPKSESNRLSPEERCKRKRKKRRDYLSRRRKRILESPPPEAVEWIDAHWETATQDPNGQFPSKILRRIAKEAGLEISGIVRETLTIHRLKTLGQKVARSNKEKAAKALRIWHSNRDSEECIYAREVAKEVGLKTIEVHGLFCKYGQTWLPKWAIAESEKNDDEVSE